MRICQTHWDKLRAAIDARGISHLGAKTGEEAMEDMKAAMEGREHDYDPLMDCNWMITTKALELGGLWLMGMDEHGEEFCPICEAVRAGAPEDHWIDGPADEALAECRRRGLTAGIQ